LNFLHKHKYDCIIEIFQFFYLNEDDKKRFIDDLKPQIIKCVKNGSKIIAIPIGFSNHFNMLIYNVELNELYRFEPHGEKYETESYINHNEKLNKILIDFVNDESIKKELGKIKYISPVESCPVIKKSVRVGFQAMENYYLQIILSDKEMEELNKKEGGFCQVWSWFMLDLIMMNPEKTITDIYKEAHISLENDPYSFRSVIRGFILEVESELVNINKDLSLQKLVSGDVQSKNKMYKFYEDEIKRLSNNSLKQINISSNNIQQKEMETKEKMESEILQEAKDEFYKVWNTKIEKDTEPYHPSYVYFKDEDDGKYYRRDWDALKKLKKIIKLYGKSKRAEYRLMYMDILKEREEKQKK